MGRGRGGELGGLGGCLPQHFAHLPCGATLGSLLLPPLGGHFPMVSATAEATGFSLLGFPLVVLTTADSVSWAFLILSVTLSELPTLLFCGFDVGRAM